MVKKCGLSHFVICSDHVFQIICITLQKVEFLFQESCSSVFEDSDSTASDFTEIRMQTFNFHVICFKQIYFVCILLHCLCFVITVFWTLKISLSVNYLVDHWIFLISQILLMFFFSPWKELFSNILSKNCLGDIIIVAEVKIQLMPNTLQPSQKEERIEPRYFELFSHKL